MADNWPRQPLILTSQLPLAWGASYWCLARMLAGCQLPVTAPDGDQVELALMLALCWVLAGGYNQLLIYRYVPGLEAGRNRGLAIANALTLICTIVLAWGKPAVVLFPRHFSPLVILLLVLALAQASLGNYFVDCIQQVPDRLPLWLGPSILAVMAMGIPLFFNSNDNWWGWLLAPVMMVLIQAATFWQLPRILAVVAARRSALYDVLVGAELAALFSSVLLGGISCYQRECGVLSRLSVCWGSAGVFLGVGAMVIAACQRYHNDFRYGHAAGHENWFVAVGALCWIGILLALILAL